MKKRLKLVLMVLFFVNIASARVIEFVGEGFIPEPNQEITVQIQTDVPLFSMGLTIEITGDMNITGAMSEADCNNYGWDNGWNSDPYIDPNGWVSISGISWTADANGVVGYIKFRYYSGAVVVSIAPEYSSAYDANHQLVGFSDKTLVFGEEENIFVQTYFPNLAGDANVINFEDFAVFAGNWQKTGSELAGDFDDSGKVDFNDLKNFCYHWLIEAEPPEEVFESFKAALTARDINEAVNYISEISRDKYYDIFYAIEPNLPDFAAGMGQMTLVSEDAGHKKYEMLHENGGQTYSFPVVFIRDDDGEWRIFNF